MLNTCISNNLITISYAEAPSVRSTAGNLAETKLLAQRNTELNKKQPQWKASVAYCKRMRTIGMVCLEAVLKWKSIISPIILWLIFGASHVLAVRKGRLMTPSTFTALSGDLHVQIQFSNNDEAASSRMPMWNSSNVLLSKELNGEENTIMSTLVISKFNDYVWPPQGLNPSSKPYGDNNNSTQHMQSTEKDAQELLQRQAKKVVQNIQIFPDPRHNVTQITVPCHTFVLGGLYEMQVISNLKTVTPLPINQTKVAGKNSFSDSSGTVTTTTLMPAYDERLRQTLDVRWPKVELSVNPIHLRTYPKAPVNVTVSFPEVNCDLSLHSDDLPEFWLELVYCGKQRNCADIFIPQNDSKSSVLFAEQIRGYPKLKSMQLQCELFGLAGNYAVQLRPMVSAPNVPHVRRLLSVDWSDEFVFNVYARSIFPCDPHTGIGVLYEYPGCILEQGDRVRLYAKLRADVASLKPPTSLHYVAEQRVVKNQFSLYFSCDIFSEKYVEYCFVYVSQAISGAVADVRMDCVPTLPVSDSDTGGWGPWSEWTPCSANCLGGTRNRYRFCDSPPPRYGAKFCEGPSVETEKCGKSIADAWDCMYVSSGLTGISKPNATEVTHEIGPGCRCGCIVHLGSSKPKRIIAGSTQSCPGRSFWLIQADSDEIISLTLNFVQLPCPIQQLRVRDGPSLSSTLLIELTGGRVYSENGGGGNAQSLSIESNNAHLLIEFLAGVEENSTSNEGTTGVPCTGGFMANVEQLVSKNTSNKAQTPLTTSVNHLSIKTRSMVKKSKSQVQFTIVHLSAMIFASIIILISALLGTQYVVRYRKYHLTEARRQDEGSRLHTPRASLTSLQSPPSRAISTTTLLSEVVYMVKMRPKHKQRHSILRESYDAENLTLETGLNDIDSKEKLRKCEENVECGSTGSVLTLRNEHSSILSASGSILSGAVSLDCAPASGDIREQANNTLPLTICCKDNTKDSESIISSGMSSLYNISPTNNKMLSKFLDSSDAMTLKLYESSPQSCKLHLRRLGTNSGSASLINGCYSPAASVVSTATIRTTNPKESKEQQNRKKLLARPESEFSLGNQEELELDYYDYNVINAGAAPGSYLGMDPAYLIWVPPCDEVIEAEDRDGDKTPEPGNFEMRCEEQKPFYEVIEIPKYGHYLSPGSNTESSKSNTVDSTPSSDEFSPLNNQQQQSKPISPCEMNRMNCIIQKSLANVDSRGQLMPLPTLFISPTQGCHVRRQLKSPVELNTSALSESIQLCVIGDAKSPNEIIIANSDGKSICQLDQCESMNGSYVEKETAVEKSTSDLHDFLALDDIQYADESGSDYETSVLKKHTAKSETTSELKSS